MALNQGFASNAGPEATGPVPEVGIGMLGYAFMGKALQCVQDDTVHDVPARGHPEAGRALRPG